MKFPPRPYQSSGHAELREKFRAGLRRLLLVMPTGTGKTGLAAMIIEATLQKGNEVLFLAHRKELIDQCSRTLDLFGVEHGVIKAGHWRERPDAPVQVASVQTLIKRKIRPRARVVILDEAHRSLNDTNQTILGWYPDALSLGLTATPTRLDGRGLGAMYESIISPITMREAIAQGYLLQPRVYEPDRPNLTGIRRTRGDYDQGQLAGRLAEQPKRIGNLVENWLELAEGQRTVCFAMNVEDSQMIVARYRDAGVAAEHLDGQTPESQRDAILSRLESGETLVVSNVDVLVEGYDLPSLGCIQLGRPTLSVTRFLQMIGRGSRPYQDQKYFVVLDHAGCCHKLGDPTADRTWTLEDRPKRERDDEGMMLTCETCSLMRPANMFRCPRCFPKTSWQSSMFAGLPIEVEGKLVERGENDPNVMCCSKCDSERVDLERFNDLQISVTCRDCSARTYQPDALATKQASETRRRAEYDRLESVRVSKGFKEGWTAHQYRNLFGDWPPKAWRKRPSSDDDEIPWTAGPD
jgi:DNA repair protein RadD